MSEERCQRRVYPAGVFSGYPCGRLVKEGGLCGIHLAADRRRAAKDEARREQWREQNEAYQTAAALAARLAKHGLTAYPQGRTGHVTLMPGSAAELADRLDATLDDALERREQD
jgi:hypothetical protein